MVGSSAPRLGCVMAPLMVSSAGPLDALACGAAWLLAAPVHQAVRPAAAATKWRLFIDMLVSSCGDLRRASYALASGLPHKKSAWLCKARQPCPAGVHGPRPG